MLGNVAHQTLLEIWHGEPLAAIRQIHLEGRRNEISMCDNCGVWSDHRYLIQLQPGVPGTSAKSDES